MNPDGYEDICDGSTSRIGGQDVENVGVMMAVYLE
jgi:hypothetical protein